MKENNKTRKFKVILEEDKAAHAFTVLVDDKGDGMLSLVELAICIALEGTPFEGAEVDTIEGVTPDKARADRVYKFWHEEFAGYVIEL